MQWFYFSPLYPNLEKDFMNNLKMIKWIYNEIFTWDDLTRKIWNSFDAKMKHEPDLNENFKKFVHFPHDENCTYIVNSRKIDGNDNDQC